MRPEWELLIFLGDRWATVGYFYTREAASRDRWVRGIVSWRARIRRLDNKELRRAAT